MPGSYPVTADPKEVCRQEILRQVVCNGYFPLKQHPELQEDREIVLATVQHNSLKFPNPISEDHQDFLLNLIEKNPWAFEYLHDDLKFKQSCTEKDNFMTKAIKKIGYSALRHIYSLKKYDQSFMKESRKICNQLIFKEHTKRFILGMALGLIISTALIGVALGVLGLNIWIWGNILPLALIAISSIAGGFFIAIKYPSAFNRQMMNDKKGFSEIDPKNHKVKLACTIDQNDQAHAVAFEIDNQDREIGRYYPHPFHSKISGRRSSASDTDTKKGLEVEGQNQQARRLTTA